MARGYANVYSGDSYAARFAGTGRPSAARDDEFRERRQAYESERMSRDLREQEREDSLNEQTRTTFSAAWDTIRNDVSGQGPLTVARDYATHASKLKAYMNAGQYEKAFGEYSILRAARDNGGDPLFALSTADPRRTGSQADADLQTGAQQLVRSGFDALDTVVKQTGETLTAHDLFHDGQAYKRFEQGNALVRNFGGDLVNASASDDEFERRIANRISESVVSGAGWKNRIQFRDLGDYVFKNAELKVMRDELGDEGVERLVEDALVNGIEDGTFKDRMDFVRDVVWQQRQADPTKDKYRLVRDNLDAFNRKVKSMTSKYTAADPASTRRFVSKVMTIAAEEHPGAIDFDDERVSERLDRWTGLAARAEQFGIPWLVDAHEGGLGVRRALRESFTPQSLSGEPSETEALVRTERAFDRVCGIFSVGGSAPGKGSGDAALALGFTSGDATLDGAMRLMAADVLKDHVLPQMYRGTREDVAIRTLSTDSSARERLAESWADAISVSTGLSRDAGSYIASMLVGKVFRDGGTVPVNLKAELTSAAFANGVPDSAAKELRRYVKARDLVDDSKLEGLLTKYRVNLADPLVGFNIRGKDVTEAYIADAKHRMISVMENGGDPSVVAAAMSRMGYPFQWTGAWVLADGTVVSDADYKRKMRTVPTEDGKGRDEKIDVKGAIPQVGKSSALVDLDHIHVYLPDFGGPDKVDLPIGSWTGNEAGFRGKMAYMKQIADLGIALQSKRAEAAAKGSGSSSGDGGISRY